MLGAVGERFSVASGSHGEVTRHRLLGSQYRHGLVRGLGRGEDLEALVGAVVTQEVGLGAARLGHPGHVLRAAPVHRAISIGVGDDEGHGATTVTGGGRSEQSVAHLVVERQIGRIDDSLRSVDQTRRCRVDQSVTTPGDQDRPCRRADHGNRLAHIDQLDRCQRLSDSRVGKSHFVEHRHLADDWCGLAERTGIAEAWWSLTEEVGDDLGSWRAEPIERQVVAHPDGVGAEQTSHGGQAHRIDHAGLEAVVERVEQIHRPRAAERQEIACDERAVGEPCERRVDRVAPAERSELRSGQLQDSVLAGAAVEGGDGLCPGRRHILVALEGRIDVAAGPGGWHVHDGERDECHGDEVALPLPLGAECRDGSSCGERHAHDSEGESPGAAAEREAGDRVDQWTHQR